MNVNPIVTTGPAIVDRSSAAAAPAKTAAPAAELMIAHSPLESRNGNSHARSDGGSPDQPASDDLQKARRLKALIADENTRLRTYHDDASGRNVLEIADRATGTVVDKYPSDELLRLYAAMREPLIDKSA